LDLKVVVSRAEGPDLLELALLGLVAHVLRVAALDPPPLFGVFQVLGETIAPLQGELRPLEQHLVDLLHR